MSELILAFALANQMLNIFGTGNILGSKMQRNRKPDLGGKDFVSQLSILIPTLSSSSKTGVGREHPSLYPPKRILASCLGVSNDHSNFYKGKLLIGLAYISEV